MTRRQDPEAGTCTGNVLPGTLCNWNTNGRCAWCGRLAPKKPRDMSFVNLIDPDPRAFLADERPDEAGVWVDAAWDEPAHFGEPL
jgi:hypothetical protein